MKMTVSMMMMMMMMVMVMMMMMMIITPWRGSELSFTNDPSRKGLMSMHAPLPPQRFFYNLQDQDPYMAPHLRDIE